MFFVDRRRCRAPLFCSLTFAMIGLLSSGCGLVRKISSAGASAIAKTEQGGNHGSGTSISISTANLPPLTRASLPSVQKLVECKAANFDAQIDESAQVGWDSETSTTRFYREHLVASEGECNGAGLRIYGAPIYAFGVTSDPHFKTIYRYYTVPSYADGPLQGCANNCGIQSWAYTHLYSQSDRVNFFVPSNQKVYSQPFLSWIGEWSGPFTVDSLQEQAFRPEVAAFSVAIDRIPGVAEVPIYECGDGVGVVGFINKRVTGKYMPGNFFWGQYRTFSGPGVTITSPTKWNPAYNVDLGTKIDSSDCFDIGFGAATKNLIGYVASGTTITLSEPSPTPTPIGPDYRAIADRNLHDLLGRDGGDVDGYWTNKLRNGESELQVRQEIASAPELQNTLSAYYKAFVGKDISSATLAYWTGQLAAWGSTLESTRIAMSQSQDVKDAYGTLYQRVLNRPIDPDAMTRSLDFARGGGAISTAVRSLAGSQEFRNGVAAAYQQVRGMAPAESVLNDLTTRAIDFVVNQNGSLKEIYSPWMANNSTVPIEIYIAQVQQLYRDIDGREGDTAGVNYWAAQLANGATLAQVRGNFANSDECQSKLAQLYLDVLGRGIDPGAAQWLTSVLTLGAETLAGIRTFLANCDESHGNINSLYVGILGRPVDNAALQTLVAALSSGSTTVAGIRSMLAHCDESRGALNNLYLNTLGRGVDSGALQNLIAWLDAGTSNLSTIRSMLAHSDEAKAEMNTLYLGILGRGVDSGALQNLIAWLDAGTSNVPAIRSMLAHSDEGKNQLNYLYQNILGRAIDPNAQQTLIASLSDGSATIPSIRSMLAHCDEARNAYNALYVTILGRAIDEAAVQRIAQDLANGTGNLSTVRNTLAHCDEARNALNAIYQGLLNRPIDTGALAYDVGLLASGGLTLPVIRTSVSQSQEAKNAVKALYAQYFNGASPQKPETIQQIAKMEGLGWDLNYLDGLLAGIHNIRLQVTGTFPCQSVSAGCERPVDDDMFVFTHGQDWANYRASLAQLYAYSLRPAAIASAAVVSTTYTQLGTWAAGCRPGNTLSVDCYTAFHQLCVNNGYTGGGYGPLETYADDLQVACVGWPGVVPLSTRFGVLSEFAAGCSSTNPGACRTAAFRYCSFFGLTGGGWVSHYSNDNVVVRCVTPLQAKVQPGSFESLHSYHQGCDGDGDHPLSPACSAAVNRYFAAHSTGTASKPVRMSITGFGPFEWSSDGNVVSALNAYTSPPASYFTVSSSNSVIQNHIALDGNWTGYMATGPEAVKAVQAVVAAESSAVELYAIGMDDAVYLRTSVDGGTTWGPYAKLGGDSATVKAIHVIGNASGMRQIYAIGMDDAIYMKQGFANGTWSAFSQVGADPTRVKGISVVGDPSRGVQIYAICSDDSVCVKQSIGQPWSTFAPLNEATHVKELAAAGDPFVGVRLFAIAEDATVITKYSAGGAWSLFATTRPGAQVKHIAPLLRGEAAGGFSGNVTRDSAQVFAIGLDNVVYEMHDTGLGTAWSPFAGVAPSPQKALSTPFTVR